MEQLWLEVVKQAPSLGVLSWLVYTFLSAQQKRDEQLKELGSTCHEFQLSISDAYKANIKGVSETIDRNTVALSANTHALGRVESVLDDLDSRIRTT